MREEKEKEWGSRIREENRREEEKNEGGGEEEKREEEKCVKRGKKEIPFLGNREEKIERSFGKSLHFH